MRTSTSGKSPLGLRAPGRKEEIISSKVFVGSVNYSTTEDKIREVFAEIGEIVEVFLPTDRATGRPRGFAFVEYRDEEAAEEAIEKLDGYELDGRNLRVSEARERPPRPPKPPFQGGGPPSGGRGRPKGSRRNIRGKKRSL